MSHNFLDELGILPLQAFPIVSPAILGDQLPGSFLVSISCLRRLVVLQYLWEYLSTSVEILLISASSNELSWMPLLSLINLEECVAIADFSAPGASACHLSDFSLTKVANQVDDDNLAVNLKL